MSELLIEQKRIQEFLSRPQFIRFAEVFETYQRLLQKNKTDQEKIKKRMRTIFDEKKPLDESEETRIKVAEFNAVKEQLLSWCESGEYTKERIAERIASSSIAEELLEQWRPQKPGRQEDGRKIVKEVLEYGRQEDGDNIYINLLPPAVKETELLRKVIKDLHIIAQELKDGIFKEAKTVLMMSWLFDRLKKGTQRLFGDTITLEDVPNTEENVRSSQGLALSYNKRSIAEYLETGKMPTVKQLTMTKEAFIKQFSPQ